MILSDVCFSYRVNGKRYTVNTDVSVANKRVSLDISEDNDIFSVRISTRTPIEAVCLTAEFDYDFRTDHRIFLNGYQSWTESREYSTDGIMRGISQIPQPVCEKYAFSAYGDYDFVSYGKEKGMLHGFSYGYIRNGFGEYDLIGSLNENDGFTVIYADTVHNRIILSKDCAGYEIGESYNGFSVYFGSGSENEVFDRYFELMSIKPPSAKPIFGYTSWYRHYQDINAAVISNDLDGLKDSAVNADVFQIDDGYQRAVGDWLDIDKAKFPDMMKTAADDIKASGLIPGIWLAPFVCEERSDIFQNKKDWLLTGENGEPVKAGSNWSGAYALDIYNDEVREYLKNVLYTVVNEWGFRLLKLDFLYAACILPRRDRTRGMIMSDAMDLLREYAGDAQILACGVPLASAFGKADYCRIGPDVSLDWNDKLYMQALHRERPSTRNTILCSVFRRQLSGRAFINDPDVFLLRDTNTSMTYEQKECLAYINALCGGVLFCSDDLAEYNDSQKEMLDGILKLRRTKVLSAELDDKTLIISAEKDGKCFILTYPLF